MATVWDKFNQKSVGFQILAAAHKNARKGWKCTPFLDIVLRILPPCGGYCINLDKDFGMRFILIDKVLALNSGKHIETIKNVSLAEEYLGDHFPTFPVLPGVFLLQGMIESASWLVREAQGFAHSMILLEQTRNVKYKSFLAPGMQINYVVDVKALEDSVSSFKAYGQSGNTRIVEARFALRHFNLADEDPAMADRDERIIQEMKNRGQLVGAC